MRKQHADDHKGGWLVVLMKSVGVLIAALFIFGLWLVYNDIVLSSRGIKVQAEIVAVAQETSSNGLRFSDNSTTYFPTFSFADQNGDIRVVKAVVGFSTPFRVGEKRDVFYNPTDPTSPVRLAEWSLFKGMGALILYITTPMILMILYSRWRGQSPENQTRHRRNKLARERRTRAKTQKRGPD